MAKEISNEKKNQIRWILKRIKDFDKKHGYFKIIGSILRKAIPLVIY